MAFDKFAMRRKRQAIGLAAFSSRRAIRYYLRTGTAVGDWLCPPRTAPVSVFAIAADAANRRYSALEALEWGQLRADGLSASEAFVFWKDPRIVAIFRTDGSLIFRNGNVRR